MKVLLYGSGAREHALALKILDSPLLEKLYLADTGAFSNLGEVIEFKDYFELAQKAREKGVDLLVVGPEKPLGEGICDIFLKYGINTIGADSSWARLESSKSFAKEFMQRNGIRTAKYFVLKNACEIESTLKKFDSPPVIKADGLASGKGVVVPENFEEAKCAARDFLGGKFAQASERIILEERLFGQEISVFSLWDGKNLLTLPPSRDFKKLNEKAGAPNTGGMGAVFPVNLNEYEKKWLEDYIQKLKNALVNEKADFRGVVYSGLMVCKDGIYVLEYNMRFGDPETQALLCGLQNDILDIFSKMIEGRLDEVALKIADTPVYCVVLASSGYPAKPLRGMEIKNLEAAKKYGVEVLFAGVKKETSRDICGRERYFTNGGRVLSLVKSGFGAREGIYKAADEIVYEGKIFRRDIDF